MQFCYSGFIAERMNLRYFLTIGTLGSGIMVYMFGMAKYYNIHTMPYFLVVQLLGGIFQSAGWPGVVTVMGNWFGEKKTGFIFGVWNSHTSVGNILGTLIAGRFVENNWALSFMVLGLIMIVLAVIIFLFLVSEPTPLNDGAKTRSSDTDDQSEATGSNEAETEEKARVEQHPILSAGQTNDSQAIGFIQAIRIPGVAEFSLCLFFAKLVSYTFLYWLPLFIRYSTSFSPEDSANLSTLFDVGGILGGIFAGVISDYTGMQAFTCGAMLVYSVPMLYIYYLYGSTCVSVSIGLLLLTGALVNGPYALITTAVSAKLGLDPTLATNTRALSTVTAIIDGTGSMGAAAGPLFAGFVSDHLGWEYVFFMLMISDVFALCVSIIISQRWKKEASGGHMCNPRCAKLTL
ncbi:hypothetical protein V9T40_008317 [Parthenolecanium corni]|uniref:Sugar phosphate exchanger 3 n=1 Tax=Parthenolecanium corni TaxID=536013 RepID=A0AAN9Y6G7_9HEMI